MRLNLRRTGSFNRELAAMGLSVEDAANAAVVRQTDESKGAMRVQIASRLSSRAANALRSRLYTNPSTTAGGQGRIGGYIHSAWWRKNRRGGPDIDMFAAFERGDVIRPARGAALAVPLPAAFEVVRGGRRGQKPTPVLVEAAVDADLFVIRRPGRPGLLAANVPVRLARGRQKVVARRYRNKKGGISKRRGQTAMVPFFVLLKNTRLPKRLDFEAVRQAKDRGLEEKFIVELARREPG